MLRGTRKHGRKCAIVEPGRRVPAMSVRQHRQETRHEYRPGERMGPEDLWEGLIVGWRAFGLYAQYSELGATLSVLVCYVRKLADWFPRFLTGGVFWVS